MKPAGRALSVIDYHTEGEPMRIVVDGAEPIPGATLMERSEHLAAHGRDLLGFTLYEPRGHSAMCGAILTEPVASGALEQAAVASSSAAARRKRPLVKAAVHIA